jgi:hypothetical protein
MSDAICHQCGEPAPRRNARYCSNRCRQAAYRARQPVTDCGRRGPAVRSIKSSASTADTPNKKTGVARYRLVPDGRWPGMWRIRRPDGTLTDMVNLTRAKDALLHLIDGGAPSAPAL